VPGQRATGEDGNALIFMEDKKAGTLSVLGRDKNTGGKVNMIHKPESADGIF
jgi:hypothetical protein